MFLLLISVVFEQCQICRTLSEMVSYAELSQSPEYSSFRSSVPLKVIVVDSYPSQGWKIYDIGPKSVKTPLVCLPPVSGTADIFYRQLMGLSAKGYRVISAENPPYWSAKEWCEGFRKLMDHLGFVKVHIFGASLGKLIIIHCNEAEALDVVKFFDKHEISSVIGGFLAQKYAEYTFQYQRVASLFLCNTYMNTSVFRMADTGSFYRTYPTMLLKRMILGNFPSKLMEKEISDSVDFMVEKLENLSRKDLCSRLSIIHVSDSVDVNKLSGLAVTISDVFDDFALSPTDRESMYRYYPQAKLAHLKTGGNFPYLSRSDEINMHLQIHLRPFLDTPLSARE